MWRSLSRARRYRVAALLHEGAAGAEVATIEGAGHLAPSRRRTPPAPAPPVRITVEPARRRAWPFVRGSWRRCRNGGFSRRSKRHRPRTKGRGAVRRNRWVVLAVALVTAFAPAAAMANAGNPQPTTGGTETLN